MTPTLNYEALAEILIYDQESGVFYWRRKGGIAGSFNKEGYIQIHAGSRVYLAHRLAWLFVYREWPRSGIDHIDRDRTNNRIENLRLASATENNWNTGLRRTNSSGVKGVSWGRVRGKWLAFIRMPNGKNKNLGGFDTIEEAAAAYASSAKSLHGEFACPESRL